MEDKMEQVPQCRMVWVGEAERVVSFHPVDAYQLEIFQDRERWLQYLRTLQERGFRFQ